MTATDTRNAIGTAAFFVAAVAWLVVNFPTRTPAAHQPARVPTHRPATVVAPTMPVRAPVDASIADVPVTTPPARPPRERHFWCTFEHITRLGWRGFTATLPDGTRLQYLTVPHRGIVRVAAGEVPDGTPPVLNTPFRTERTAWGWDAGVGHVGQRVMLGEETFCYEWRDERLMETPCRR